MIQLGQQPEAGLRASEGRATGRLMLLHPKLSHSPRHGQRPLRPVWPGCLVARAAVRAVVCRWKKDPNQVKKAKNNLAASRVFLSCPLNLSAPCLDAPGLQEMELGKCLSPARQ